MTDYSGRIIEEYDQLHQRIEKLKQFILTDKYDALPEIDRTDLKSQLLHMQSYFSVLSRRVSRQCNSA